MRWLLLKDLQILRRSPLLVGLLVVYPVLIALLIGLALSRGPDKPRVAFANLIPPAERTIELGGDRINLSTYSRELFRAIEPLPVRTRAEALAKVESGDALAALIIPADTPARLQSQLEPARVEVVYNGDALKQQFVESAIESKLGEANAALAGTLKDIAVKDVDLLVDGGRLSLLGRELEILGLRNTRTIIDAALRRLPRSPERDALQRVSRFADLAVGNLDLSKKRRTFLDGRRTPLDSYGVAISVTTSLMFVCVLLAAGMLALEREENAFGRLVRGLVGRGVLVTEKVVLAAACSFAVALAMLAGIGLFVDLDWSRFALWAAALAGGSLAFGALGVAIGALAREVRAASLLAFLLTLPIAFLALVPSGAVAQGLYDVIRVVSAAMPFKPTLQGVDAALHDTSPGVGQSVAHLAALAAAFGLVARVALRRFA
jgi:hypothetical protein